MVLRGYIIFNSNEDNGGNNGAFCDYYELGNWFWEAMEACDFDVDDFLDEVEQELATAFRESVQDFANLMAECLEVIGIK